MKSNGLWANQNEFRQFSAIQNPNVKEIATRKMAEFLTSSLYLPNPDEVLRKLGKSTVAIYREIFTDARVGAAVDQMKDGVKSLGWEIETGKGDENHADFCRDFFENLDVPRIIGEILNAPLYGYQPLERIWQSDGQRLYPEDLVGKPQEWFVYGPENELRFVPKGELQGIPVDPFKFQVARHEADYRNPYGFAILSRCWWPVVFKRGGIQFWVMFCEKWGMPHAVAKMPPGTNKEKVDEVLDMLERLVQDGIAVVSDNAKIELLESKSASASADLYKQLVNGMNDEVSTAILGHQGNVSSTPGKLGGEQIADNVRENVLWARKNLVQNELSLLIKDTITLNFGSQKRYPRFKFFDEENIDKTRAERDAIVQEKILAPMKKRFTPAYLQEKHGYSEEDFEDAPEATPPTIAKPEAQPLPPTQPKPVEFAAGNTDAELKAAEVALQNLTESFAPKDLQGFAEDALAPVLKAVRDAKGYEDLNQKLADLFPEMESERFQAALGKALFLSESMGRAR